MKELKIDRTIRELIPPLTSQEYSDLEDSIIKGGCRHPIVIWAGKDIIIDGHNRYDICVKNKIEFKVEEIEFATKKEALIWMYDTQLGRRNLTDAARIELALKRDALRGNVSVSNLTRERRDEIAGELDVSQGNIAKVKKVITKGDKKTKKAMRDGNISINMADRIADGKPPTPEPKPEPKPEPPTVADDEMPCPHCHGTGKVKKAAAHTSTTDYWQCGECKRKVFTNRDTLVICPSCGAKV